MALTERIETLLVGNATGLVNTFKEGGSAADAFAAKTTTTGRVMDKLGLQGLSTGEMISKGLTYGTAAGAVALGAFALKGVQTFSDLTSTVRGFQRVTGASAEDSSRLAAATERMGIDAGTAQSAFGQLAKRIGEGKDTLSQWNVEIVRNKDGSVNFARTLENISEKYSSLTDATQRQAFATENFGKGAQSINALLGQGKENLQQFYAVAEGDHHIFSQDDLNKGLEFSRSLKDLQTQIQGVQIELGKALLPAVKTLADITKLAVAGLDQLGGSMSGATVLAGGFALAGAKIAGPWGAAAGATLGVLAQGIEDFSNRTLYAKDVVEKFVPVLARMDAQEAAAEWDKAVHKMQDASGIISGVSSKLKLFKELADSDPTQAQKIVTGMQQRGESTEAYDKILGKVIQHNKDAAAANQAAASAASGSVSAQDQSTGAVTRTQQAVKDYVSALDAQKKALDAVQSALLAQQGGEIGRQQALLNVTSAQNDYNDAVNQYGADSPQAVAASLALQQAHLAVVDATDKANQATEDLNAKFKDPAAVQSEIDRLQDLINKYGDADGSIQSQIDKLHAYQYTLALTQPAVVTNVTVEGLDDALFKVGLLQEQLGYVTAHDWNVAVNIMGNASAPHTG